MDVRICGLFVFERFPIATLQFSGGREKTEGRQKSRLLADAGNRREGDDQAARR